MNQSQFSSLVVRYVIGFAGALCLSVLAYLLVAKEWFDSPKATMAALLVLAAVQLFVQVICFLHLNLHGRTRGRTFSFVFTIVMMLIIVVGSLWIMKNLDYNMDMSGEAMNEYMEAQNKKGF